MFFDGFHDGLGQYAADRADDPIAVELRGGLGNDFKCRQARHGVDCGDRIADIDAEYLPYIRGRVGADEQDALAGIGEANGCGTGDRGFPYTPFASEEKKARRLFEKFHNPSPAGPQPLPGQQLPALAASLGGAMAAQRASSARVG